MVDGVWMIDDLGSTLGTTINGSPLRGAVELHAGDKILLGRTIALEVGIQRAENV
jgi:pSer/pThr/pTyr-binding forkhead associated (FHA) protein